ncbi:hypothetical protein [Virgibacillus sp. Bac332]|uniref:hypothetical protein n=1 Tax=Virgibacillus sp. Bac332 TaxID=2419842 RepID=UPI0013CE7405|nr:hypothetical protein [Virgibacillus sp. Bac332]
MKLPSVFKTYTYKGFIRHILWQRLCDLLPFRPEPIGHLLAVDPHLSILVSLDCLKWGLTASYMRDKKKYMVI